MNYRLLLCCVCVVAALGQVCAQSARISGQVVSGSESIPFALLKIDSLTLTSNENGFFEQQLTPGHHQIRVAFFGYKAYFKEINLSEGEHMKLKIELEEQVNQLQEVVISHTAKPLSRSESPVAIEMYSPVFFQKNPTANIFEALQNVNGVRPQLNCNVCNTGDIHINGLEGPYTMVLIDGMPIVSSLSTVYGLSGIPNSLIERVEIIKGPASSLYGSEAVGGVINIITKSAENSPQLSADVFSTSWLEHNVDLGFKNQLGEKVTFFTGVNYFNYALPIDNNKDNFTDLTLQDRISLFQKWSFNRKNGKKLSFASRYFSEDRWGGQMNWTPQFRGGDSIYGENIVTKRFELIGSYQLPVKPDIELQVSYNRHHQNSAYGSTFYLAQQNIAFSQLMWRQSIKKHELLTGMALRYTFYDDNTGATAQLDGLSNKASHTTLPGVFVQDEVALHEKHRLLLGLRYDYNTNHGSILTPRVAHKYNINKKNTLRLNAGTGYRVVNLFTEEHASLTGAREIVILEDLNPEQSYNLTLNFEKKIYPGSNTILNLDISSWYTYFGNQIIPDYDTHPNQIIYANLDGYARSMGFSINVDYTLGTNWSLLTGATVMDVSFVENGVKERPFLTENWSAVWALSYHLPTIGLSFDYTGNMYGAMRLPLAGELDPRSPYSPVWSIQNIKISYQKSGSHLKIYAGIKNLLNWTPAKNIPFLIAQSNDPFDKTAVYNNEGVIQPTAANPYALSFDPTYVYAPNQGIRFFAGLTFLIK